MEGKDTILLACADPENRKHLQFVLKERFNLLEAVNLRQMLLLLEQNRTCVAAVVLGTSVLKQEEAKALRNEENDALLRAFPVMVVTEEEDDQDLGEYFRWGAADAIQLHYEPYAMLRRIEVITQFYLDKQRLERMIREQGDQLRRANDNMVDVLSSIIEYRSMESGDHILKIRNFTRILAEEVMRQCPEYGLTDRTVTIIASASALHDIGKIAIPDAILEKPGPLSAEEWEVMKTHTVIGCRILKTLDCMADQEYLRYAYNICRYHHERWDGGGYPEGLSGEAIPICAQVVGLADVYEALTAQREYKEPCSFEQAVNMILKGECGAFSLKLLECFKNVSPQFETLTREYREGRPPEETSFDMTLPPAVDQPEKPSMDRIRAKYYTLVHYLGAFLIEISLDKGLFHVVYDPYTELPGMEGITSLEQFTELVLNQVVVPEERDRMADLIFKGVPQFVDEDLRRASYWFHFQENEGRGVGCYEVTLLRIGSNGPRSLALLVRRVQEEQKTVKAPVQSQRPLIAEASYVCRNDQHFTLEHWGQEALGVGSYNRDEIRALFGGRLDTLIHPEDRAMVREEFTRQLRISNTVRLEHRVVLKNGGTMWVVNKSRLVVGEDGQEHLYCSLTDVTPTRQAYEAIQKKHAQYREILNRTRNVLFVWDVIRDTVDYSDTWHGIFSFEPPRSGMFYTLAQSSHIHPDDVPRLLDHVTNLRSGADMASMDVRIATDKGSYSWCRFRACGEQDEQGRLRKIIGMITNVEEEKRQERALKDRADRDSLTKLLNKAAGRKQVEDYLSYYPDGVNCAMVIIDLDNFKQLNDQHGHLFGDTVLTKVAREIRSQFQGQDIVCRIGGDEFMVLVRGTSDRYLLEKRCRQLITAMSRGIWDRSQKLAVGCSIGIALCPQHGMTYHELFIHADQALYQAKAKGKNGFCVYEPGSGPFQGHFAGTTAVSQQIDSDVEPGLAEDNIVRHSFQLLYTAKDPIDGVNQVIGYLGQKMNVSRVYIFENSDDNRYCSNTFEWCNRGIRAEIGNLQNISYETDIPNYADNFDEQGLFYCPDISVLPKATYDIVAPQGIKSMLHCAIRQDGVFRGYIGFDECVRQRLWTKEEIRMLSYFSEMLSLFLMRYREQQRLDQRTEDIRTLLDNQDCWIYIVDPETWELQYRNEKVRQSAPGAAPGRLCFLGLRGGSQCCPDCPAGNIRETGTCRRIIWDEGHQTEVLLEATMIRWHGKDSCLISYRPLPRREKGEAR